MTDDLENLHRSTSESLRQLMHLSWELQEIAASLGHVGNHDLARTLSEIGREIMQAQQTINRNDGQRVNLELQRSEQATANMMLAALNALTTPRTVPRTG